MPQMDDQELKALIDSEVENATTQAYSQIAEQRMTALQYYLGEPMGNEIEGRSQVVSTDVADTIEWIMPSLLKIFTSGDQIVVFDPVGKEDEKWADQATDYCNFVIQKDNNGFELFYVWFKDALLSKNGVVKYYWDESIEKVKEQYQGLTDTELAFLMEDPDLEAVEHTERQIEIIDPNTQQMEPQTVHDVTFTRQQKKGRVVIENVPPEEFLISRRARTTDPQAAPFCAHRTPKTRSELVAMGFDKALVDSLEGNDNDMDMTSEAAQRRSLLEGNASDRFTGGLESDKPSETLWVYECYLQVDYDGDGIAEWRKILKVGTEIIANDECPDGPQFASITPIIMPHVFHGLSIADLVMDLQQIKTALFRNVLDNQYLINNSRHVVLEDQVNIDDLLVSRPGGIIREKVMGALRPLETAPLGPTAFSMIEYVDTARENRTGVTKYNQGLDANSLNKTATGISAIQNASQQRIELIARVFAETGVKSLFRGVLKLICKHQDVARTLRIRNQWVDFDPRNFNPEYDVTITVGLGTGNKDQMLQHIMAIMQVQQAMMQGGMGGVTVTPQNLYNSASKMVENSGFKEVELFFTDPVDPETGQMRQPPAPPADPKVQLEQQKVQNDAVARAKELQIKQGELALKDKDITLSHEREIARINLEHKKVDTQTAMQQQQSQVDQQFRNKDMALKVRQMKAGEQNGAKVENMQVEQTKNGAIAAADDGYKQTFIQIHRNPETGLIDSAELIEVPNDDMDESQELQGLDNEQMPGDGNPQDQGPQMPQDASVPGTGLPPIEPGMPPQPYVPPQPGDIPPQQS